MGLKVVLFNRETNDWCFNANPPLRPCAPTDNSTKVTELFKGWVAEPAKGSISLQHDAFPVTSSLIDSTLNVLKGSVYNLATVSTCINQAAYDENIWAKLAKNGTM